MFNIPNYLRSRSNPWLIVLGLLPLAPSIAQERGQTVWIPMQDKGLFGSREIKLETTVYKPEGAGPFPVVIFNHGSTGMGALPATRTENPSGFGRNLLKKGIALIVPMRRGRGQSEGAYQEPYECSLHQVRNGIRYAMESLDAVYAYLKQQP
jgi:predicted acyl esterase